MCMKYINTNIQCFDITTKDLFGNVGFSSILESVKSKQIDDKFLIDGFNIVTFINIRGTKSESNPNNPVDMKKKLSFRIRLTKLSENEEEQISYDLNDFDIDLSDEAIIKKACFKYTERIEVTTIDNLTLDKNGSYVIKVLVKESDKKLYDVQMLHPLFIR